MLLLNRCLNPFSKPPVLQDASAFTLTPDDISMTRPTCHIILTHLLDLSSLLASEPSMLTPPFCSKLPKWDAKMWPLPCLSVRWELLWPALWSISAVTHLTPWKVWQLHSHVVFPHRFHPMPGCNHTASCSRAPHCWLESIWWLAGKTIGGDKIFTHSR